MDRLGPIILAAATVAGCGDLGRERGQQDAPDVDGTDSGAESTGADPTPDPGGDRLDVGGGAAPGCGDIDLGCTDQIDLLFVIDNSGTMGEEQLNLARNFPLLVQKLENLTDAAGERVDPDVHVMVTTTDFGNPACPDRAGYAPAKGAPQASNCHERLDHFTSITMPPTTVTEACTDVCPNAAVAPTGHHIAFRGLDPADNNIPDTPAVDINGDGMPDSEVAQALACIGPQGIDGCGYESPLESIVQALNPSADHNTGPDAFLRPDALLAIVVITDEADCSVQDFSIMNDVGLWATNPATGNREPSSAICWSAGVSCNGPDANGLYDGCSSTPDGGLQPVTRYIQFLTDQLRDQDGKEVVMLGILGVPPVTAHNPEAPFEPTTGGVHDLVVRDWRPGTFDGTPMGGDILPDDVAAGVTAADKQFDFGVGPGCTGSDGQGGFTGQAIPPVRIREVCESLDRENPDGSTEVRCCIESICDTDFSAAIGCLTGAISDAIVVPG